MKWLLDTSVFSQPLKKSPNQTALKRWKNVGDLDLLIAATASVHGLTVATFNHRDFSRIGGLAWEDWSDS